MCKNKTFQPNRKFHITTSNHILDFEVKELCLYKKDNIYNYFHNNNRSYLQRHNACFQHLYNDRLWKKLISSGWHLHVSIHEAKNLLLSPAKAGVEKCTLLEHTYFSNVSFAILHTSLALMLIYCCWKTKHTRNITLYSIRDHFSS